MKKIILLVLMAFTWLTGFSQQLVENFDSTTALPDPTTGVWALGSGNWLVRDNRDNAPVNWEFGPEVYGANSAPQAAFIQREILEPGTTAEEWLITPQLNVGANSQIRFFTKQTLTGDTGTKYQIRVSTNADPSILSAYTIVTEYSETQLSTLTPSQLDYEEKVINLTFTGNRFFAFVKVFTSTETIPSGDRWLIDDVQIIERCVDPTNFGVKDVTATGSTLTWVSSAQSFDVEYGLSGFTPGTGTGFPLVTGLLNNTAGNQPNFYVIPVGVLTPSTSYQFYVTAHCSNGNDSPQTGPFNWTTSPLGLTCAGPIVIANPLPYFVTDDTIQYGNFVNNNSPGSTGCGTTGNYLSGNDVVYTYTVPSTTTGLLNIQLNPLGQTGTSVFVYGSCANIGSSCLAGVGNTNASIRNINLVVTENQVIFIVVSSNNTISSYDYTLSLQDANCIPPANGMVIANSEGLSDAQLTWQNGTGSTATAWQVVVQPTTGSIPTGPGYETTNNINLSAAEAFGGPLTAATTYQFWVRSKCDDGSYSVWSGPYFFETKICEAVNQCNYTFTMRDSFGDGWNGATMLVRQNGITVATLTGPTDAQNLNPVSVTVSMCDGFPFDLFWTEGGSFPGEVRIAITNSFSQQIFAITESSSELANSVVFAGTVDCLNPLCLVPTNVTVPTVTNYGATINWTTSGIPTSGWELYVVPSTSPAPTGSSIPTYTVTGTTSSFVITDGLIADVCYNVYVRSVCTVNSPSDWTATAVQFCTIPSCYKPTNIQVADADINSSNATVTWTPGQNGAAWQVKFVPSPSTLPLSEIGWSDTVTTTSYTPPIGTLLPYTLYDVYVRTICDGGADIGQPEGPVTFRTLPTCPQPINLGVQETLPTSAILQWEEVGTATSWEVFLVPYDSPLPLPGTGVIVSTPTYTTPGVLEPGIYQFYVRSICSETDQSFIAGVATFFIYAPPLELCAEVVVDVETTSPGVIDLCAGENCIDLSATYTDSKDTSAYKMVPVTFTPPFNISGGINLSIATDDIWSPAFTLPFNFCYYGVNYPKIWVGSNGVVTFTQPENLQFCPYNLEPDQTLPNAGFPIKNAIYGVYQDINPAVSTAPLVHNITYQVIGEAPCRTFVVNFFQIPQFLCNLEVGLQTSQIVLYETSNIVEVYVGDRTPCDSWNDGLGVLGMQNEAGTLASTPPGRNLGNWEAHDEAWRFVPDGASNVEFKWFRGTEEISSDSTINVCVSETTIITASAIYTGCGGQSNSKSVDILLRINEVDVPEIEDVTACDQYFLPALTVGNYYLQSGGLGAPVDITIPVTETTQFFAYAAVTAVTPPCTDEEVFTVNIITSAAPTFNIPTLCLNSTPPALPATSLEGNTGTWSPSTIDTSVVGEFPFTFTPDPVVGACLLPATVNVIVQSEILPLFDPIANVCQFSTAPVLPLVSTNGVSGTWNPATLDTAVAGLATFQFTPDASEACAITTTFSITVDAQINPTFDPIADVCVGSPVVLPATSLEGLTGTWSPAVVDTSVAGTYPVIFTPDAGQGCTVPVTLNATVLVVPVVTVSNVFSCGPYTLPALTVGNYFSSPNGVDPITTTQIVTDTVIYVYAQAGNCSDEDSFTVTIGTVPVVTEMEDVVVCTEYTLPVFIPAVSNQAYYTQPNGGGQVLPAGTVLTTSQTVYIYASTGSGSTLCFDEDSFTVSVGTPSEFNIQGECEGSEYVLSVMSGSSIADGAEYQWLDPNGNAIAGADKPSVTVAIAGTYSLVVTTAGCSVTQTFMANSISCMIQRGISPRGTNGGDGKNDYFDLTSLNVTKLEIFNRYGTQVYSKVNYSREWYGQSDKGEELADGTYFYVIERAGVEPVTGWIYINREK